MPVLILLLSLAALLLVTLYIVVQMCFRVRSSGVDEPRAHLPRGRQYLEIKDKKYKTFIKTKKIVHHKKS